MDGRDHGHGAFGGDGLSEAVPVGGGPCRSGIGQADLGRPAFDQGVGLRVFALTSTRQALKRGAQKDGSGSLSRG
jgi:hypothetical protein